MSDKDDNKNDGGNLFKRRGMPKEFADALKKTTESCETQITLQYGTEERAIPCKDGTTVVEAFFAASEHLGLDPDRQMTFRCGDDVVSGDEKVRTGMTYTASINMEQKGNV